MKKRYVDGYVLVVPKKKLKTYRKMAIDAAQVWMDCGALQVFENVGEDLKSAAQWGCLPFPKMTQAKPSEVVVFSFIVYKSRAHRDRVNAKVMKEMSKDKKRFEDDCKKVFDMKKMAVGGFETIVNYSAD